MKIQHRSHEHQLIFRKKFQMICADDIGDCSGCNGRLSGPVYICKRTDCIFRLHKSCAELPSQVPHPLHPQHELTLDDINQSQFLICNGCGDLFRGFAYKCNCCQFVLDVKCALLMDGYHSNHESLEMKRMACEATLNHFSHRHALYLCNLRPPFQDYCCCCNDVISGFAYVCVDCEFHVHELCMENIPNEAVQLIFHPQHSFRAQPLRLKLDETNCHACAKFIWGIGLRCAECDINIHVSCADFFRRALKSKCHGHNLFQFESSKIPSKDCKTCDNCHEMCMGSCYRCIKCRVNFHLECIGIPSSVIHKCHNLHPLTFESFLEDDSGEYYCDVCETRGNPKYPVYCCEECTLIAHIECIVSEDVNTLEILSYLNPRCNIVKAEQDNNTAEKSDGRQEVDAEQELKSVADEENPELESEIANLQAQMEALATKLNDVKGKRARKLQSKVSGFREKILEI